MEGTLHSLSSLSDVATAATTTNKFKAKIQKHQTKGKTLKAANKRNSKQGQKSPRTKSFLEVNIKNAGSTASRRKSSDDRDTDPENATKVTKSANATKRNSISEGSIKTKNIVGRKSTSREQKALHSAYACLMAEYYRRMEVRKNIAVKFGRANAKLKLIMAQRKVGDQTQKDGLAALISKRKSNDKEKLKVNNSDSQRGGKAFAKVQNYDDPDRI